ncbi:hypothetical protein [Ralstonia sp. A12]|uniref:hypothetical protein n=1 Tax=Ralstonia sp. A12 TaxID=1217052 RepID=UPI0012EDCE45|nr:hypothetical protein [Ralstonia sp. A12]
MRLFSVQTVAPVLGSMPLILKLKQEGTSMAVSPEQLSALLTYCTDFSRTMLERAGDFYPFGATLSKDGTLGAAGGHNGEERPKPLEIYTLLAQAFKADALNGNVLATALAANVNIPPEYSPSAPDGVRVHVEAEGYSRFFYGPYRITKQGFLKKTFVVEFDEWFAVEIPPQFFRAGGG